MEAVSCCGGFVVQQDMKHVLRSMYVLVNFLLRKCCTAVAKKFEGLEASLLIGIKALVLRTRMIGIKY